MKRYLSGTSFCLLCLIFVACGDADEKEEEVVAPALGACKAYCAARVAAACGDHASVDACVRDTCSNIVVGTSACEQAQKAYYDCLKAQSDVCANGCTSQFSESQAECI